jgi:hypothetical protein
VEIHDFTELHEEIVMTEVNAEEEMVLTKELNA